MTKPGIEKTDQHDTKSESVIPDVTTLRQRVLSLPTLITIIIGATLLGFALWRIFDFDWDEVWSNI